MAAAPTEVTIRMYNVGFGDCFLLTFKYPDGERHMLVDCGSTSAPKRAGKNPHFMEKVVADIERVCSGKLHVLLATHRHRDHVSGFSTELKTGRAIAALKPDHVIQPWTEDPRARTDAATAAASIYTSGKPDTKKMTAHFLGALEDMHEVAAAIKHAASRAGLAGRETLKRLEFCGDDNIKNPSAVKNLIAMGNRAKAWYVNAGMELKILPGVKCTVLGPPTLEQSDAIRKQRARDPANFWQFRSFWGAQGMAMRGRPQRGKRAAGAQAARTSALPKSVRWFVKQARQVHVDELLSIVRDLDSVMNNTSVILLLEAGKRKILLPGDAQIENWAYALSNPKWRKLLEDVSLYKVGHHGSLNATPKPLWGLFKHRGAPETSDRLQTLCSTKAGQHGSRKSGTEVPRQVLVEQLEKHSRFISSESAENAFCNQVTLDC
jgi:beta-lactamase superfamily II metal-dependent hydrolase